MGGAQPNWEFLELLESPQSFYRVLSFDGQNFILAQRSVGWWVMNNMIGLIFLGGGRLTLFLCGNSLVTWNSLLLFHFFRAFDLWVILSHIILNRNHGVVQFFILVRRKLVEINFCFKVWFSRNACTFTSWFVFSMDGCKTGIKEIWPIDMRKSIRRSRTGNTYWLDIHILVQLWQFLKTKEWLAELKSRDELVQCKTIPWDFFLVVWLGDFFGSSCTCSSKTSLIFLCLYWRDQQSKSLFLLEE